jgi:serine protease Do
VTIASRVERECPDCQAATFWKSGKPSDNGEATLVCCDSCLRTCRTLYARARGVSDSSGWRRSSRSHAPPDGTSNPRPHVQARESPPVLGEDVAVLGFPLDLPLSLSKGLVSGSDRTIPIEGIVRRKLVQTDAAVNHGNSGGPLISLKTGEVIGLVDIGTTEANGLAFAVNSQVAKPLLRAWALSPQPISAQSCGGSEPTSTVVARSQPPQPTVDASAVEATVQSHWDLINAGDYAAAYEYFSPRFRAGVSRQGWINDKLRDRPTAYDMTFLGVSGDEEEADVQLQLETSGFETSPTNTGCNDWKGSYHLVKLTGRWLIDSSHLGRTPCG